VPLWRVAGLWFRRELLYHAVMNESFRVGSLTRALTGLAITVASVATVLATRGIDWGVGWMVWVPAVVVLFPAAALMRQVVLRFDHQEAGQTLEIAYGFLWRRAYALPTAAAAVEVVPLAGLQGVIWHVGGHSWPLALWIGQRRTRALLTWLDAHAPDAGGWPRRQSERGEWDR
jgi:hypothetical protein